MQKTDKIYRSTLYSFDDQFQLLHPDVANLGKSATYPKYCLVIVDLFTAKVYVYLMKSRKSIAKKLEIFYKKIESKRKKMKKLGFKPILNLNSKKYAN